MLCKYYSPVCTTATGYMTCPSPLVKKLSRFMKTKRFALNLITETWHAIRVWTWQGERPSSLFCSLLRRETFTSRSTSPLQTPPPLSRLPSRQPRLGNRSLFKSFMSTPQKRKACRKLWDRNEEGVIAPLICDDLRHDACDWFDNQALFPFRRGRKVKSAILARFPLFFPLFCFTDKCLYFLSSSASMDFFPPFLPPLSPLTHLINILLNSQIQ